MVVCNTIYNQTCEYQMVVCNYNQTCEYQMVVCNTVYNQVCEYNKLYSVIMFTIKHVNTKW